VVRGCSSAAAMMLDETILEILQASQLARDIVKVAYTVVITSR
jgi:hypothetical protein